MIKKSLVMGSISFVGIVVIAVGVTFIFLNGGNSGVGDSGDSGVGDSSGLGGGSSGGGDLGEDFGGVGGSGGDLSGGGEEDSGEESSSNCSTRQISYSIMGFEVTSDCNELIGDVCINKTVTASFVVKNNDADLGGYFTIETLFLEDGANGKESGFDFSSERFLLEALEENPITKISQITSSGENGLANKDINCFYNAVEVPQKEVC